MRKAQFATNSDFSNYIHDDMTTMMMAHTESSINSV